MRFPFKWNQIVEHNLSLFESQNISESLDLLLHTRSDRNSLACPNGISCVLLQRIVFRQRLFDRVVVTTRSTGPIILQLLLQSRSSPSVLHRARCGDSNSCEGLQFTLEAGRNHPRSAVEHEETTSRVSAVDTPSRGNSCEPSRFPPQKRLTNLRPCYFVLLSIRRARDSPRLIRLSLSTTGTGIYVSRYRIYVNAALTGDAKNI